MAVRGTFQPKDPEEKISLPFDFTRDLDDESINVGTPLAAFTLEAGTEGTDPTLAGNGTPQIVGGFVYVPVKEGVAQCDYVVTCRIETSGGRVLKSAGLLPVRAA